MIAINLDKLNVNEAELKAFIHQKVDEIQQFADGVPVAMKMTTTKDGQFSVKIVASHDIGDIQAEGVSDSIFEAITKAKEVIMSYFTEISNVVPDNERDVEIRSLMNGPKYIH